MRGSILLRGMRWRLGASVLTVLTATIAVGVAVLGPLYLRTAGDSVVRTTINSAAIPDRGASLIARVGEGATLAEIQQAERGVENAGGPHRFYGQPITTVLSGVRLVGPGNSPYVSELLSRSGVCGVLHFKSGGCDLAAGTVVLSDRTANQLHVSTGGTLAVGVLGSGAPLRLKVGGVYATPNVELPYWWGEGAGYFAFGHTGGPKGTPELDPLISSAATALAVPRADVPTVLGQVPLRPSTVNLSTEPALQHALAVATAAAARQHLLLRTPLPSVLGGAGHQRHVMSTIVAVAAVQLVLLAIWVLASLLVRNADARRSEIRVARLRGFPAQTVVAVAAAEPAALCLIGVPLGIGVAWFVVVLARGQLLNPAAAIVPDLWVFAALAATVLAIAGALGVGTFRLLRGSGLSEARKPAGGPSRQSALVADALMLGLSVVALVALATSGALAGHSDPIASAAPGLIALGAAVIAVQLVLFACRLGMSATAGSKRVAGMLAMRQIVRRPAVLRQARVLIIALCLACFASSAWSVAQTNRAAVARFDVGTANVVTVTPHRAGFVRAVERVDPAGRFAMAAVAVRTESSALLAVDSSRLGAVVSWPNGVLSSTGTGLARALNPRAAPSVNLPGAPVEVVADMTSRPAGGGDLALALWLSDPQAGTSIVQLGRLRSGSFTYRGSLALACPTGCRLAGVGVVPVGAGKGPTAALALRITHVLVQSAGSGWTPINADLSSGQWRPTANGVRIDAGPSGGLGMVIPASVAASYVGATGPSTPPMASVADASSQVPGIATGELESINGASLTGGSVPSQGLDGNTLNIRPVATATAIPRLGGDAVLVDLGVLQRVQVNPTISGATDQVWLSPAAPADAIARLQRAGLQIEQVQRASVVFAGLQRSGPALADDFLLLATIAALLAAAASTLGALGATIRQRATELTALEVGGVRRLVLARALAIETGVMVLTALFGAVAGVLAAAMAIPSLPVLASPSLVPLHYGLPVGLLVLVSVVAIAVVVAASAGVSVVLVRRMSPVLLRTAPNDTAG